MTSTMSISNWNQVSLLNEAPPKPLQNLRTWEVEAEYLAILDGFQLHHTFRLDTLIRFGGDADEMATIKECVRFLITQKLVNQVHRGLYRITFLGRATARHYAAILDDEPVWASED